MWKYVGIVRTNERLQKALGQIMEIRAQVEDMYASGKLSPSLIELRNIALAGELIIRSSLSRKESRGLNYNLDYPESKEEEKHDTILSTEC
jgi:L-aspartate oxidase